MTVAATEIRLQTYAFPGRWMSDGELDRLRAEIHDLTRRALGRLPDYGVYLEDRRPFENRFVTIARSVADGQVVGFTAMVRWEIQLPDRRAPEPVVHLGLVLVDPELRGRKIMYGMYHRPLTRYFVNRGARRLWITSASMEPVIVGSVADSFSRVFPHYLGSGSPSSAQLAIARTFLESHGHEIGLWSGASFDARQFVIRGSALGASASLIVPYERSARYRVEACNEFCRRTLDYARGDEFLQVGQVDLAAVARSAWWIAGRLRRRFARRASALARPGPVP